MMYDVNDREELAEVDMTEDEFDRAWQAGEPVLVVSWRQDVSQWWTTMVNHEGAASTSYGDSRWDIDTTADARPAASAR